MKDEIIYFGTYDKKELSAIEQSLLKHYPHKYRLGEKPKDKKKRDPQEILAKSIKKKEKRQQKELEEIWEEYDKYKKNPKKYNKKRENRENMILKYFQIQEEKNNEKLKGKMGKIIKMEEEVAKIDLECYLKIQELRERYASIMRTKKSFKNPNKAYTKRIIQSVEDKAGDAKRIALLKSLEEELLEKLQDPLMLAADNIAVDFKDEMIKKKKKKKKLPKDIQRIII